MNSIPSKAKRDDPDGPQTGYHGKLTHKILETKCVAMVMMTLMTLITLIIMRMTPMLVTFVGIDKESIFQENEEVYGTPSLEKSHQSCKFSTL